MSIRTRRVARLLQREIAEVLGRDYGRELLVTVTGARMTRDLSVAYIHVSVLGTTPEERLDAFRQLEAHGVQIRAALAQRIRHQLRAIPEIRFFLDESLQESRRMDSLFEKIREERKRREIET